MGELLKGKVAVVTGGGRGIGRAIVLCLAEEGAKVVVNDLGTSSEGKGSDSAPASEVVAEIKNKGWDAVANFDSVATWEGGESIIKTAVDTFGKIDILVNNAGILRDRMVWNMSEEEWDSVIKTHLYGSFYCTRHAAGIMRQQKWGRIIFICSSAITGVTPGQPNYSSAKGGMMAFSRTCAISLGRYGVTSNAIWAHADTRMTMSDIVRKKIESGELKPPPGRREPETNAPLVAFLASDAAANINGQLFEVSGNAISLILWPPMPVKTIFSRGELWKVADLVSDIPNTLASDLVNPAPPQE